MTNSAWLLVTGDVTENLSPVNAGGVPADPDQVATVVTASVVTITPRDSAMGMWGTKPARVKIQTC